MSFAAAKRCERETANHALRKVRIIACGSAAGVGRVAIGFPVNKSKLYAAL